MKNDKEMERFCKNIRSLRKFHKLNQKQMAEKFANRRSKLKNIIMDTLIGKILAKNLKKN